MIVVQDWGDRDYFVKNRGRDLADNPTNNTLHGLLASIGIDIEKPTLLDSGGGAIFLTNAVLCLKNGGMQGPADSTWFANCRSRFLRPTIEISALKLLLR